LNLIVSNRERIAIVDDDKAVRDVYAYAIGGDEFEPVDQVGPLGSLDSFLGRHINATAAVSDHKLTQQGNYAQFDGAPLVARWYQKDFPAVLCTTYSVSSADHFRSFRRWIPVVLPPEQLSQETVSEGLGVVRAELAGVFKPERRPRRALVRFVEYVEQNRLVYVKLPGWGTDVVSLRVPDLPSGLRSLVTHVPDFRAYAQVNLATDSPNELYLAEWEFKS